MWDVPIIAALAAVVMKNYFVGRRIIAVDLELVTVVELAMVMRLLGSTFAV